MKPLSFRLSSTLGVLGLAALTLAQDLETPVKETATKTAEAETSSFMSGLTSITNGWWIGTMVATAILGLVVGYLMYRSFVAKGQAGKATGCGCLMAVAVFLLAQSIVAVVLVATLFAGEANKQAEKEKKPPVTSPGTDTTTEKPVGDKPVDPPKVEGAGEGF
ncbi:hypothetical protein EON79_05675 [bacterium]|nr:MAG: hypothetical protein EON79_05675 [bacterium]